MQTKQEIFDPVSELLVVLFEVDKEDITLESRLYEDLDIDSIDAVDLVVELRKKIGRKIAPEVFKTVRTMEDVVGAVDALLHE